MKLQKQYDGDELGNLDHCLPHPIVIDDFLSNEDYTNWHRVRLIIFKKYNGPLDGRMALDTLKGMLLEGKF